MTASVTVRGGKEVQRALRKLAEKSQQSFVDVVNATGEEIATETKTNVPVDTGRLRSSYRMLRTAKPIAKPVATVGTEVFYAPFVEKGTRYMEPRPHLQPAAEYGKKRLVELAKIAMKRDIRDARR